MKWLIEKRADKWVAVPPGDLPPKIPTFNTHGEAVAFMNTAFKVLALANRDQGFRLFLTMLARQAKGPQGELPSTT